MAGLPFVFKAISVKNDNWLLRDLIHNLIIFSNTPRILWSWMFPTYQQLLVIQFSLTSRRFRKVVQSWGSWGPPTPCWLSMMLQSRSRWLRLAFLSSRSSRWAWISAGTLTGWMMDRLSGSWKSQTDSRFSTSAAARVSLTPPWCACPAGTSSTCTWAGAAWPAAAGTGWSCWWRSGAGLWLTWTLATPRTTELWTGLSWLWWRMRMC